MSNPPEHPPLDVAALLRKQIAALDEGEHWRLPGGGGAAIRVPGGLGVFLGREHAEAILAALEGLGQRVNDLEAALRETDLKLFTWTAGVGTVDVAKDDGWRPLSVRELRQKNAELLAAREAEEVGADG